MGAVLVTGGAGYVGSHVCKALAAAGETPVTFDNLSTGHRAAARWGPLIEDNICNGDIVGALMEYKIDAVMHFAGSSCVAESVLFPRAYFQNNVVGSLTLLNAAIFAGVKYFVFSSSAAVYGDEDVDWLEERDLTRPTSPYGESKLFVERALAAYAKAYGLKFISLRYFNAAGADSDGEIGERHDPETHLIPLAIDAALTGGEFKLFGNDYPTPDGTAIRDYVHVSDLADAHVKALQYLRGGGESKTLNLGSGQGASVRQVTYAVELATEKRINVQIAPRRAGDPVQLVASISEARRILGWRPSLLSEPTNIIKTALAWRLRK
jgi:UDP-arabinose 4-epimerase